MFESKMKTVAAFLVLVGVVAFVNARKPLPAGFVYKEVKLLYQRNPSISKDDCISQCDDLFQLIDANDQKILDNLCQSNCECFTTLKAQCPHPTHAPKTDKTLGRGKRRGHHSHHSRSRSRRVIHRPLHARGTSKPVVG